MQFSCTDADVRTSSDTNTNKQQFIHFQGEKVLLPVGVSEHDFEIYLANKESEGMPSTNARTTSDFPEFLNGVTVDIYFQALFEATGNYPSMKKDKFDKTDLALISKHIPSIETDTLAKEKKALLWDYYNVLIRKDIEKILTTKKFKSGLRALDIPTPEGSHAYDIYVMNSDPLAAPIWLNTYSKGVDAADSRYGNHLDGYLQNAYQHAVTNALAIRDINLHHPDKQYGIRIIRKFANAHEYVPADGNFNHLSQSWSQGTTIDNAMDLHNNLVGRTYMQDHVNTFLGRVSSVPSRSNIENAFYIMGHVGIGTADAIRLRNPDRTWYILGDKDGGRNYDLYPAVRTTLCYWKL